jgi:hypothetical protein
MKPNNIIHCHVYPGNASAAQPTTFNGNTSWSVFRLQFGTVAEHNHWSHEEKSTYLITALKVRAGDVLHGIPTNTTYEKTLQALEGRFGDQNFAAVYGYQLTTRTQRPENPCKTSPRPSCQPHSARGPHIERSRENFRLQCR